MDTARDGREGILKLQALRPQVVTMDVEMPVMDGLQALEEIMRWQPTPVIILSAVTTEGAQATLKALDLGAFDVVAKPSGSPGADLQALSQDLVEKVKAAAGVNPARLGRKSVPLGYCRSNDCKLRHKGSDTYWGGESPSGQAPRLSGTGKMASLPKHAVEIVAIGTSTGGPSALQAVLPTLPANFPVPVLGRSTHASGFYRATRPALEWALPTKC